jgi:hypothetical protein
MIDYSRLGEPHSDGIGACPLAEDAGHAPPPARAGSFLGRSRLRIPEHSIARSDDILMNRINPALFAAAFAAWVRESWP